MRFLSVCELVSGCCDVMQCLEVCFHVLRSQHHAAPHFQRAHARCLSVLSVHGYVDAVPILARHRSSLLAALVYLLPRLCRSYSPLEAFHDPSWSAPMTLPTLFPFPRLLPRYSSSSSGAAWPCGALICIVPAVFCVYAATACSSKSKQSLSVDSTPRVSQ